MEKLSYLKNKKQCVIREFAQLVGMLTAACPAIKYGWLHKKPFERERYLALEKNNENYNKIIKLIEVLEFESRSRSRSISNRSPF